MYIHCIRGMSALAVMFGHGVGLLPNPPLIGTHYPIQSYGVVLFFVMSGFLIAYNCMTRAGYSFGEYMIDRFSRIYVAFVPAILLVALVDPLYKTVGNANSPETFVANIFMLHNTPFNRILDGLPRFEPYGSGRQFWTVALEWWLYSLFGILFFARASSLRERTAMALLLLPALTIVAYFTAKESIAVVWIIAAAGAVAFCSVSSIGQARGLALAAPLFFAFMLVCRFIVIDVGPKLNAYDLDFMVVTAGLFLSVLFLTAESTMLSRLFVWSSPLWLWLSGISYSLYLTHQTLHYWWRAKIGVSGWPSMLAIFAASIVLAWVFTWAFDQHYRAVAKTLKRLLNRRRAATAPIE